MTDEEHPDKVKIVATVMASVPPLVLRLGVAYLRMKRCARKTTKIFEKGMLDRGMAPEMAHRLAMGYEGGLSIRTMLGQMPGGNFLRK